MYLFLVLLAVVVALVTAPSVASATDYGVDMSQACQISYGAGWQAELTYPGQGAYGWRCWVPPWGAIRKSVNVQAYCSYFGLGTAVVLDPNNPYSWRCRT
jgi:hypothetical protein